MASTVKPAKIPNQNLTIMSLLISGAPCTHGGRFDDLKDKGGVSITAASYQYQLGGLQDGVNGAFIYLPQQ